MSLREKVQKMLESFPKVKVVGDTNQNPWVAMTERYYTIGEVNEWKERLAAIMNDSEQKQPMPFRPSLHDVHACMQMMLALNEVDPNIAQFWFEPIKEMLSQIELPDIPCDICKAPMPFYEYYLKQGMCDKCASETDVGEFDGEP